MTKRGSTLVEVLVYTALVSGILIAATSFAWNVINNRTKSFVIQEVEQNGRLIIAKITQAVHQANSINYPAVGDSGSQLSLGMREEAVNPIIFNLAGQSLIVSQAGSASIPLNTDSVEVTSLEFENLSGVSSHSGNVYIVLKLHYRNPSNKQEWEYSKVFQTAIELRDK